MSGNRINRRLLGQLSFGAAVGLAMGKGLLPLSLGSASAAELPSKLRVSTFRQPYYYSPYYLNRFAPSGMSIEVVETKSNSDALDALLTGDTDVAYMGVISCLIAVAGGRPIKGVASAGSGTTRILVRADSDITAVKDLKGKDVAIAKGTNQDIIFREVVRQAGLDPNKDINYVLLPSDAHVQAMVTGTVVACSATEPYGSMMLMNGVARQLGDDVNHTRVGNPGILVALKQDTIDNRPELAQVVTTMHARTVAWMRSNPDQVIADFAKFSKQEPPVIKMAMENTALHYDINEQYLTDAQGLISSLLDWKYLSKTFEPKGAFDLQFLPAARTAAKEGI
ncbi:ABC transporter substrate-binding protein [Phyllobacterium endophyticum]|uniref:ABC transporter substrate-binding protein n=1 Tax=Phyllobacterium endophyticum TaxID=1149773 RepID=UPI0011C7A35E|nr:ABC transporter substrate-binding protein [Phyllobacterium endophyticum]TXR47497.1 ABC transporter substrate-binding protein [Phyllobacterium endophyticum]